jgi:alpha-N-arabinofuranosidase
VSRKLVTTALLGKTAISDAAYEQPDGSPIRIDTDYFGNCRNPANPTPGPFEVPGQGKVVVRVY